MHTLRCQCFLVFHVQGAELEVLHRVSAEIHLHLATSV